MADVERVKHHNIQRLIKSRVESNVNGEFVDSELSNSTIIRKAEKDEILVRYNEDMFYCCYRTKYKAKDCVLLLIAIKLPGPSTGSSTSSLLVIDILNMIEKKLMPLEHTFYARELDSSDKSIGILKIIKHFN